MKNIKIKSPQDIQKIKTSGIFLNDLLIQLRDFSKKGVKLGDIEQLSRKIFETNSDYKASFKGYNGYPNTICLSVNDVLVHGVDDNYILQDGDLLKIDAGAAYQNMVSDAAICVVIGQNTNAQKLVDICKGALDSAISIIKPGLSLYDLGRHIDQYTKKHGATVVKTLGGHGVGHKLHEDPFIYNYAENKARNIRLQSGMVIAVEPIISYRSFDYVIYPHNRYNLCTQHGDLGAQREYTLAITDRGCEILAGIQ